MARKSWPFRISAFLIALVLCYFAATMSLAAYLRDRSAQTALKIASYNAAALAGAANDLLQADQSDDAMATVRRQAQAALQREPLNVLALRTLGLTASLEGDETLARAYFTLASRLTKRDLPLQLWWIEQKVTEGNLDQILTYYDQALKTSQRANNVLLPVLTQASAEPLIAQRLPPLLASRPSYFRQFFIQGTDNAINITGLARIGRQVLDRGDSDDQDLINRTIMRFAREQNFDEAWDMFAWAYGGTPDAKVLNGDFQKPVAFRLFNWDFTQSDAVTAEIGPRDDTDSLYLIANVSQGLAARQLLRLPPGRYRLQALVGDVPEAAIDRPTIAISCAVGDGTPLPPSDFPTSPSGQANLQETLNVRSGCRYQWLELTASAVSQDEVRTWIDDISIRPEG